LSCAREISVSSADFVLLRRSAAVAHLPTNPLYVGPDFLIADLVLRMTRAGLRAICVPSVRVQSSASPSELCCGRKGIDDLVFRDIWGNGAILYDPFYNQSFSGARVDYK